MAELTKEQVLETLSKSKTPVSATELFLASDLPNCDFNTVERVLYLLIDEGKVAKDTVYYLKEKHKNKATKV